ncbi:MAG: hypothetical protein K2O02_00470 [Lachnospiraceae bacterium]|nr:hypothetical protein [Lachnospiraceae bacterium]
MKKKKIMIIAGIAVVLIIAAVIIFINLSGGSRTGIILVFGWENKYKLIKGVYSI